MTTTDFDWTLVNRRRLLWPTIFLGESGVERVAMTMDAIARQERVAVMAFIAKELVEHLQPHLPNSLWTQALNLWTSMM